LRFQVILPSSSLANCVYITRQVSLLWRASLVLNSYKVIDREKNCHATSMKNGKSLEYICPKFEDKKIVK